jgi:hypothetical protein
MRDISIIMDPMVEFLTGDILSREHERNCQTSKKGKQQIVDP